MPSYPIVEVHWIDSSGASGWFPQAKAQAECDDWDLRCWTTGYLFREDEDRVTVAQSHAAATGNSVGNLLAIPRGAITKMTVLKKAKK